MATSDKNNLIESDQAGSTSLSDKSLQNSNQPHPTSSPINFNPNQQKLIDDQLPHLQHQHPSAPVPPLEITNGDQLSNSNSILISLLKPTALESTSPSNRDQIVKVNYPKTTVLDLKSLISKHWNGKPKLEGIRLIARGRILNDSESVGEALTKQPGDSSTYPIHVVIRPNAWTEKLSVPPTPPRPVSAPPTAPAETNPNPLSSTHLNTPSPLNPTQSHNMPTISTQIPAQPLTPAQTPHESLLFHFAYLTRDQRISFLDNLQRAQSSVVERLAFLRRKLYQTHLNSLGLQLSTVESEPDCLVAEHQEQNWKTVEQRLITLLKDIQFWGDYDHLEPMDFGEYMNHSQQFETPSEFERVEISGLPFLLYVPNSIHNRQLNKSAQIIDGQQAVKKLQKDLAVTLHLDTQLGTVTQFVKKLQSNRTRLENWINTPIGPIQRAQHLLHPADRAGVAAAFDAAAAAAAGVGVGPLPEGILPGQINMPPGALFPHAFPRVRRYEFTINLDRIRRYMAPLIWLSLKLSVLLYIFGRHASTNKLAILIAIAVGWVIWEAYTIGQRHDAVNRRRDRVQRVQGGAVDPIQAVLDRGRRRAERERQQRLLRGQNPEARPVPNPPPQPPAPALAAPPATPGTIGRRRRDLRTAAADIRARGGAFPPGTEVRPFRATSALSPKYWFNSIAVVGLASEYRELGLHPVGERRLGAAHAAYPSWYRYLRNTKTCLVLFIGTLVPEIEKKRRKALEKRSRILNMVVADAERDRVAEQEREAVVVEPADEGTPRAVRATGVQVGIGESTMGLARRLQTAAEADQPVEAVSTPLIPTSAATANRAESTSLIEPAAIPAQSSSSTASLNPNPAAQDPAPSGSSMVVEEPPLTPVNERQVVGGLDDTDDDDDVAGGAEEEAGMVLF